MYNRYFSFHSLSCGWHFVLFSFIISFHLRIIRLCVRLSFHSTRHGQLKIGRVLDHGAVQYVGVNHGYVRVVRGSSSRRQPWNGPYIPRTWRLHIPRRIRTTRVSVLFTLRPARLNVLSTVCSKYSIVNECFNQPFCFYQTFLVTFVNCSFAWKSYSFFECTLVLVL